MSEAIDTNESAVRTDNEFETRFVAVLSDPNRKRILGALTETNGQLTLAELATAVADENAGYRDSQRRDDVERRTAATLYHRDLPKLADTGLVEWSAESHRAALTSEGAAFVDAFKL